MVKNSKKILKLKKKIKEIRYNFLKLISKGVKYHIGGSLSVMDIIVCLIYSNKIDLTKTSNIRNKLILSKGHALGIFYTILMDLNLLSEKKYFSQIKNNKFGGQLDTYNCKYVDWSTWLFRSFNRCIDRNGFSKSQKNYYYCWRCGN